jgi:hypothetical protein
VILNALMASEGVGRFSELSTRSLLQTGRLVPALADWEVQGGPPLNLICAGATARRNDRLAARQLEALDIAVRRGVGRIGVVGTPRVGSSKRSVGLRADMDALPVQEANRYRHASRHAAGRGHPPGAQAARPESGVDTAWAAAQSAPTRSTVSPS